MQAQSTINQIKLISTETPIPMTTLKLYEEDQILSISVESDNHFWVEVIQNDHLTNTQEKKVDRSFVVVPAGTVFDFSNLVYLCTCSERNSTQKYYLFERMV